MIIKINDFSKYVKIDRSCVVNDEKMKDLRLFVIERDNHKCVYCGDNKGPFEADHIMPKSRGGLDVMTNLVCACRDCNRAKKDKTPEEWIGVKNG